MPKKTGADVLRCRLPPRYPGTSAGQTMPEKSVMTVTILPETDKGAFVMEGGHHVLDTEGKPIR